MVYQCFLQLVPQIITTTSYYKGSSVGVDSAPLFLPKCRRPLHSVFSVLFLCGGFTLGAGPWAASLWVGTSLRSGLLVVVDGRRHGDACRHLQYASLSGRSMALLRPRILPCIDALGFSVGASVECESNGGVCAATVVASAHHSDAVVWQKSSYEGAAEEHSEEAENELPGSISAEREAENSFDDTRSRCVAQAGGG